jgi:pimeloyl-ACP methyl ester carboxylesterase
MVNLDGTGKIVELAPGYRIAAPGLSGTAETHTGRAPHTRNGGPEQATAAFDQALQNSGVNDVMTIEMDVHGVPVSRAERPLRTPNKEDGLMLEVPDLGASVGQLVLAIDEDGVVTWNFPVDQTGNLQTPAMRGASNSKRFVTRRHTPKASPSAEGPRRGLVQILGRKILKVLVYPVTDPVLGAVSEKFAQKWEEKKRPYRVRTFTPGNYLLADTPMLSLDEWKMLSAGRALLFIHGTNSSSHTGFANFPPQTLEELYSGYGGRIFAFDHFTLSEDPEQNVKWFLGHIPLGMELNIDIICHSRGGLVARTLIDQLGHDPSLKLKVRRIVFAGTPNNGTILASAKYMTDFIDRYTSLLNLAPPGPYSTVVEILEGIITAVKLIGHGALKGLSGIAPMDPQSPFLKRLNSPGTQTNTQYFALTSDFEPTGGLKDWIEDQMADRVFGQEKNDLLVPTDGVYKGIKAFGFPIPDDRALVFTPSQGVAHSYYFTHPDTSFKLKEWLL